MRLELLYKRLRNLSARSAGVSRHETKLCTGEQVSRVYVATPQHYCVGQGGATRLETSLVTCRRIVFDLLRGRVSRGAYRPVASMPGLREIRVQRWVSGRRLAGVRWELQWQLGAVGLKHDGDRSGMNRERVAVACKGPLV